MKLILIPTFILFACFIKATAQQPEMVIGSEFKTDTREVPIELLAHNEQGYYMLYAEGKFGQGEASIVKFNHDLLPSSEKLTLSVSDKADEFESLGFVRLDTLLYHLTIIDIPKARFFYAQAVNISSFTLGTKSIIHTYVHNGAVDVSSMDVSYFTSKGATGFSLLMSMPDEKDMQKKLQLLEYDKELQLISDNTYWLPYHSLQLQITQILIEDEAVLLLARNYFRTNIYTAKNRKEYDYILFKLADDEVHEVTKIGINKKHLSQIKMRKIGEDSIVFVGLFSERDYYAAKGTFLFNFDLRNESLSTPQFEYFPKDYFSKLLLNPEKNEIDRRFDKGKQEEKNLMMFSVLARPEGEFTIVAEDFSVASTSSGLHFHYGNITVVQLGGSGKLQWISKIAKDNSFYQHPFYSHFLLLDNYPNSMHFFYNDDKRNVVHTRGPIYQAFPMFGGKEHLVLMHMELKPDGSYKRNIVTTEEEFDGFRVRTDFYEWINEEEVLIFAQHAANVKKQRLIKLKLNSKSGI